MLLVSYFAASLPIWIWGFFSGMIYDAKVIMPMMRHISTALLFVSVLIFTACTEKNEDFSLEEAWDNASSFLVNDANRIFQKFQIADNEHYREAQLGLAVTLLDKQPKVTANLQRARSILESLISESDSDEVGVFARYTLGHYFLLHDPSQNLSSAMDVFSKLFRQMPHLKISQFAFALHSMVSLSPQITPEHEFDFKVAELEKAAERLTFPEAETMFHLAVAYAANLRGLMPDKVINHLRAAQELGLMDFRRLGDSYVMAGNLALKLGDLETANEQFSRFLKEFPRDVRNYTIQQMLNQINNVATVESKANES